MVIIPTTSVNANVPIVDIPIQNYADILGYEKISISADELIESTIGFSTSKHVKIFNHLLVLTELLRIYACRGSLEFALMSK